MTETHLPPAVVDAIKASIDNTHAAFFSEKPSFEGDNNTFHDGECIAGIIGFVGDVNCSVTWILTSETAPVLAQRFAGFEIPFESSDMGDIAGELVNVIAGEIVAQLERRQIKAQMTLPTVASGRPISFLPEFGPSIANLKYSSKEGPFWMRIAAATSRTAKIPHK